MIVLTNKKEQIRRPNSGQFPQDDHFPFFTYWAPTNINTSKPFKTLLIRLRSLLFLDKNIKIRFFLWNENKLKISFYRWIINAIPAYLYDTPQNLDS